jgi:hypothetical protein
MAELARLVDALAPSPDGPGYGRLHNTERIAAPHVDGGRGSLADQLTSEEVPA